jgi:hypothetical protein
MSYSPAPNEFPISSSNTVGIPPTVAAYLRCIVQRLVPGVSATVFAVCLDVNGNVIPMASFNKTISLTSQTALNAAVLTSLEALATANGFTIT